MIEVLAAVLMVLSVWLAGKQETLNWPIGIVAVVLYGWVFWQAGLYGAAGLQALYLAQSIWGWIEWSAEDKPIRQLDRTGWLHVAVAFFVGLLWTYCGLLSFSVAPFLDAVTVVLSLIATWLLTYRYLDTWYVWAATNVLYAGLFLSQGLYVTASLSLALLVVNRIAFLSWTHPQPQAP